MSNFVIPKGKDFDFTIKVMQQDSFLPEDLTDMQVATFSLIKKDTQTYVHTSLTNISLIVVDAINGNLKGSIPGSATVLLDATGRGDKVDNYYLKPLYQGVLEISFTVASGTPRITTIIDDVYVIATGVN